MSHPEWEIEFPTGERLLILHTREPVTDPQLRRLQSGRGIAAANRMNSYKVHIRPAEMFGRNEVADTVTVLMS